MRLWLLTICLGGALASAQTAPAPAHQEPPEEDVTVEEQKEYTFNPLQAAKEMKVGAFYLKKGSYKAAVRRFNEALKWDPNTTDAYLRLAEAYMKMGDRKSAREAWNKYLETNPEGKDAAAVRKKLADAK